MDWQVRLKSGIPFQRLTSLSDTASRARYLPWHMCEERGCQAMQKALGFCVGQDTSTGQYGRVHECWRKTAVQGLDAEGLRAGRGRDTVPAGQHVCTTPGKRGSSSAGC